MTLTFDDLQFVLFMEFFEPNYRLYDDLQCAKLLIKDVGSYSDTNKMKLIQFVNLLCIASFNFFPGWWFLMQVDAIAGIRVSIGSVQDPRF